MLHPGTRSFSSGSIASTIRSYAIGRWWKEEWLVKELMTVPFECIENMMPMASLSINTGLLRTASKAIFRTCGYTTTGPDVHSIDPHLLFHFRAEIDAYVRRTSQCEAKRVKETRNKEALSDEASQCRLLLDYVGEEFAGVEEQVEAMLKRGVIHCDLVWTLFRPETIAYTSTYQNKNDPRCFRVETVRQDDGWVIDGKYLDCYGERFSTRRHQVVIPAFEGCRKISNLTAYPLQYHQDPDVNQAPLCPE
jgi:hypothetical protein